MNELRNKFAEELDTVDWRALRVQAARDSVILVAPELDLVEVACTVAGNRADQVSGWIAAGRLRKPDAGELAAWECHLDKAFRILIVAPYVLIQAVCDG